MVNYFSKIFFTATVTSPTFFSLGLIGIVKDWQNYSIIWRDAIHHLKFPIDIEWWCINFSFIFTLVCFFGIYMSLKKKAKRVNEAKTIKVQSYSNLSQGGADQVLSSIIPWLTIFADDLDFIVLFICVILQCCFIAIASYNNNNYNLVCSVLGYRYYQVETEENTYILLSKRCIKNKSDIKQYMEVTDYMGLIIK